MGSFCMLRTSKHLLLVKQVLVSDCYVASFFNDEDRNCRLSTSARANATH